MGGEKGPGLSLARAMTETSEEIPTRRISVSEVDAGTIQGIPLGKGRTIPLQLLPNIVGGSLVILSLELPWANLSGSPLSVMDSGGSYPWAVPWLLAGGALSLVCSLGGLISLFGTLTFLSQPYGFLGVRWTPGIGLWLSIIGSLISLGGSTWTISQLNGKVREIVGGVLWSAGFVIIATIMISASSSSSASSSPAFMMANFPLVGVASLLAFAGLRMIFRPRTSSRTVSNPGTILGENVIN